MRPLATGSIRAVTSTELALPHPHWATPPNQKKGGGEHSGEVPQDASCFCHVMGALLHPHQCWAGTDAISHSHPRSHDKLGEKLAVETGSSYFNGLSFHSPTAAVAVAVKKSGSEGRQGSWLWKNGFPSLAAAFFLLLHHWSSSLPLCGHVAAATKNSSGGRPLRKVLPLTGV